VSLASSATQNVTVSIVEVPSALPNPYSTGQLSRAHAGIAFAFLGPLAFLSLAGIRRRSLLLRTFLLVGLISCLAFGVSGCSSSNSPAGTPPSGTPETVQVTINATSGTLTHSTPITVTFQ
jgi:hypothetical protein